MKRKTKQDLECENARLRAEIEGYKAALKITQDYAELMKLAIPVQPTYPVWPWNSGTWCGGTAVVDTVVTLPGNPPVLDFKVTS